MITRRMLEMAAKAAGIIHEGPASFGAALLVPDPAGKEYPSPWNPGGDDGDAFRLADALHLMVDMDERRVRVICGPMTRIVEIPYGVHDRMAINRLAIVMIAAEIGEAMVD
jgi:hypothetical protein